MPDIPPNFGRREFDSQEEALKFIQNYEFDLVERRSDFDIYETKKSPRVRANLYQEKNGQWVVAKQMRAINS